MILFITLLTVQGACETRRDIYYSNACLYVAAVGDIVSDLMSISSVQL